MFGPWVLLSVLAALAPSLPHRSSDCAGAPNNYYVATTGKDTNDGSACHPWATLQRAAGVVSPGATVTVEDGTYSQTVTVTRGGSSGYPITFQAQHKWGAKLAPASGNGDNDVFEIVTGYVNVQGFEISGANSSGGIANGIRSHPNYNNVNIVGNKIHNLGNSSCVRGGGILSGANRSLITGNYIYQIGLPYSATPNCPYQHGIYGVGSETGAYYANNVIFQIYQGYAVHLNDKGINNITFTNNTIFNVGDGSMGGGMHFECGGGTCDYLTFSNNIMTNFHTNKYNNGCLGESIESGSGGVFGTHNTFANNLVDSSCLVSPNVWLSGNHDVNTIVASPLYVNYTGDINGDYHLQSTSPGNGKGTQTVGLTNLASASWPMSTSNGTHVLAPPYDCDGIARGRDMLSTGALQRSQRLGPA